MAAHSFNFRCRLVLIETKSVANGFGNSSFN